MLLVIFISFLYFHDMCPWGKSFKSRNRLVSHCASFFLFGILNQKTSHFKKKRKKSLVEKVSFRECRGILYRRYIFSVNKILSSDYRLKRRDREVDSFIFHSYFIHFHFSELFEKKFFFHSSFFLLDTKSSPSGGGNCSERVSETSRLLEYNFSSVKDEGNF